MRGFQAANIGVMVNGVPVNDMEWGGRLLEQLGRSFRRDPFYANTTRSWSVEGVFAYSVGGTINIVTRTTDQKKGGSVSYGIGNDGMNNIMFNVSSGLTKSGWAFTLLGGKRWGDGYIQGTEFEL